MKTAAPVLLAVLLAGLSLPASPAQARPVACSLTIAEREVFAGDACDFRAHGSDGSFQLSAADGGYFVYVNMDGEGSAKGYWNGWERASRAHDDLGTLTRDKADPACWSNGYAAVCAR